MSKKRNIAVSRFSSEYIAFIDSDASPGKNWLFKSINILEKKKIHIVGGPNLPFNYKEYWKKITHYCKRSFFITAKYNFINYKSKNRITDLLHSSNFIISKKKYLSVNGMNEKLYIGEDHDFFFRLNRKFKDLKILFDKEVFVYHEDRELKFFLLQRFCYGLNIFTSNNTTTKRLFASIPFLIIFLLLSILILNKNQFIQLAIYGFVASIFLIFLDINNYVSKTLDKFVVILSILSANMFYGLGTIFYFFGIRSLIEKKIYRSIKTSKKISSKSFV